MYTHKHIYQTRLFNLDLVDGSIAHLESLQDESIMNSGLRMNDLVLWILNCVNQKNLKDFIKVRFLGLLPVLLIHSIYCSTLEIGTFHQCQVALMPLSCPHIVNHFS